MLTVLFLLSFFFTDPATTEIYTLSLHDALPISVRAGAISASACQGVGILCARQEGRTLHGPGPDDPPGFRDIRTDRKSTRLNSSHSQISYAVFCLKKKKKTIKIEKIQ